MCDSLRIIPIIINWANKAASYVVTNPTFLLPIERKSFYWVVTAVDPFCDCQFKMACVVTMCVIGTCLQLNFR